MRDTRQRIAAAFHDRGAMTIAEAMHATGIDGERIRRFVKPPHYRRVGTEWATRNWAVTWELVDDSTIRKEEP